MSCGVLPFKTAEANAKSFLRTQGVIDQYLNIPEGKLNLFRELNGNYTRQLKEKYKLEGKLFSETNNGTKAVPNKKIFKEIDRINGVFYSKGGITTKQEGTLNHTISRIENLNARFEEFGISAQVEIDGDIQESGVYIPVGSEEHQRLVELGTVPKTQPVIKINPNRLFADTVSHEFSHLFIDILGGATNDRVANVIKELKGTDMWNSVAAAYPELNETDLGVEVLATAMGAETEQLLSSTDKLTSRLRALIKGLFRTIARKLGISKENAADLAKIMISNDNISIDNYVPSTSIQKQKAKITNPKAIEKTILDMHSKIAMDEKTHTYYYYTGNNLTTDLAKADYSDASIWRKADTSVTQIFNDFDREATLSRLSLEKLGYEKDKDLKELTTQELAEYTKEIQSLSDSWDLAAKKGTQLHAIAERILNGEIISPETKSGQTFVSKITSFKNSLPKGSKILTEVRVYDEETNTAGTVDVVVIEPDGKLSIYDYKTSTSNKFYTSNNEISPFVESYVKQLLSYGTILSVKYNVGTKINKLEVVPFKITTDPKTETITTVIPYNNVNVLAYKYKNELKEEVFNYFGIAMPPRKELTEIKDESIKIKDALINLIHSIKGNTAQDVELKQRFQELLGKLFAAPKTAKSQKALNDTAILVDKQSLSEFIAEVGSRVLAIEDEINTTISNGKNVDGAKLIRFYSEMKALSVIDGINDAFLDGKLNFMTGYGKFTFDELNESTKELKTGDLAFVFPKIVARREHIENRLKTLMANRTADVIADTTNIGERIYHNQFKEEFDMANKVKYKTGSVKSIASNKYEVNGEMITKAEYESLLNAHIAERFAAIEPEIKEHKKQVARDYLSKIPFDLNAFSANLLDPGQINNTLIKTVLRLVDEKDKLTQDTMRDKQKILAPLFRNFASENKTGVLHRNPEKIFDKFIDKDSKGKATGYLVSEIKAEFYLTYRKLYEESPAKAKKFYADNIDREGTKITVKPKWLNPAYEAAKADPLYNFLVSTLKESEAIVSNSGSSSLIVNFRGLEFLRMPAITKSSIDRFGSNLSENPITKVKREIQDSFGKRPDDDVYGEDVTGSENANYIAMQTDLLGREIYNIPVFYRNKLGETEEEHLSNLSFDLIETVMMNYYMALNFKNTKNVETDIEIIRLTADSSDTRVVQRKNFKKLRQKFSIDNQDVTTEFSKSPLFKTLEDLIKDRVYGVNQVRWDIGNINMDKAVGGLARYTGMLGMSLNYIASPVNWFNGSIQNAIEALSGDRFGKTDLAAATKKYHLDLATGGILNDIGKLSPESQTNLLMEMFDVRHHFKKLDSAFKGINDTRLKQMAQLSAFNAMQDMGEHHIQGNLMYAVLNQIKMKDADGNYITKEGIVTEEFDKAMTLDEALQVKVIVKRDGVELTIDPKDVTDTDTVIKAHHLVLNPKVKSTSISSDKTSLEELMFKVQMKIKDLSWDLHGQYDDKMKARAQRYSLGSLVYLFRKWILRPGARRMGNLTSHNPFGELSDIDEEVLEFDENFQLKEGYYTSTLRFISGMIRDVQAVRRLQVSENWNKLGESEKRNVLKSAYDAMFLVTMYLVWAGLDFEQEACEGDDCDGILYSALLSRRLFSELIFFSDPREAYKIVKSPTASLSTIATFMRLVEYSAFPGEDAFYKQGDRKGEWKGLKQMYNLVPVVRQENRNLKESYDWLVNAQTL